MKIAVCVPHGGDVKAKFAESLAHLMLNRGQLDIGISFFSHSILPYSRHQLLMTALDWGAAWILFVDSDQTFPPNTLHRLLAHGKDAVGCNCPRRDGSGPVIPTDIGLKEVEYIGLGVFLVSRRAIETVARNGDAFPLFMLDLVEQGRGYVGEDVFFCNKLKAAGVPVYCDHDLSREIGHIGEFTLKLGESGNAGPILPTAGDQQGR